MSRRLKDHILVGVLLTVALFTGCSVHLPSTCAYGERGLAYWYESKNIAGGDLHQSHEMTAEHRTLPLQIYVEVTNLSNNRTTIVKIDGHGPFNDNYLIDLSYAAAAKLDMLGQGPIPVLVRTSDGTRDLRCGEFDHSVEVADQPVRTPSIGAITIEPDTRNPSTWKPPKVEAARQQSQIPEAVVVSRQSEASKPVEAVPVESGVVSPTSSVAASTRQSVTGFATQSVNLAANKLSDVFLQVGAFLNRQNALRLQRRISQHVTASVRIVEHPVSDENFYRVQVGPLYSSSEAEQVKRDLRLLGIYESFLIGHQRQ